MLFNGVALKEFRRKARMSQGHLARATDLSKPYVSQLETGVRTPSLDAIDRITEALDVADPRALYLDLSSDELLRELVNVRAREQDV